MFSQKIKNLTTLETNYKKLLNMINMHENIVILRHERPDPDAIGAQLGLKEILRKMFPNKTVRAFGEDELSLSILGEMDAYEDLSSRLVIVVDTANTGRIDGELFESDTVVKIDHHPNHDPFGEINIVETGVSSTSELIYLLQDCWGYQNDYLNDRSARLLFIGIVGDTGRFLFDNTTSTTHQVVAELKKFNFDATEMMNELSKQSLKQFKFKGYLINNFVLNEHGLLYTIIGKGVLEAYDVNVTEASLLINLYRDLDDVRVWFVAIEDDEYYRIRLRSKGMVINDVAEHFGGGGHPLASGVRANSIERIEKIVKHLNDKLIEY